MGRVSYDDVWIVWLVLDAMGAMFDLTWKNLPMLLLAGGTIAAARWEA